MGDGRAWLTVATRGFAIAGVALVVGLVHAMVSQVSVTVDDARATRAAQQDAGAATAETASAETSPAKTASADTATAAPEDIAELSAETFDAASLEEEITLEQTVALVESGNVFVIDARSREEFVEGHLPGAMWMPAEELSGGEPPMAFYMLELGVPIVIYCGGGDCDASHNVAIRLAMQGFEQTHIFVDGYPAWVDAGHEVSTGPDPLWEDG